MSFASALLDELMGRNRNVLVEEKPKQMSWDDPGICKFYMVRFCPHDLFANTRADMGRCSKIHDESLKKEFGKASSCRRMSYEDEFIKFAEDMLAKVKIKKSKQRPSLTQNEKPQSLTLAQQQKNEEKIGTLTKKVDSIVSEAEKEELKKRVEVSHGVQTAKVAAAQEKQMEECDVCGAFLVADDAQQRIDHLMDKQHVGYAKLKAAVQQIHHERQKVKECRENQREKGQEVRRKVVEELEKRNQREDERTRDNRRSRDCEKQLIRSTDRKRSHRSRSPHRRRCLEEGEGMPHHEQCDTSKDNEIMVCQVYQIGSSESDGEKDGSSVVSSKKIIRSKEVSNSRPSELNDGIICDGLKKRKVVSDFSNEIICVKSSELKQKESKIIIDLSNEAVCDTSSEASDSSGEIIYDGPSEGKSDKVIKDSELIDEILYDAPKKVKKGSEPCNEIVRDDSSVLNLKKHSEPSDGIICDETSVGQNNVGCQLPHGSSEVESVGESISDKADDDDIRIIEDSSQISEFSFEPVDLAWQKKAAANLGLEVYHDIPVMEWVSLPQKVAHPSKVWRVKGDGNCFFRCISSLVVGDEGCHRNVREKVSAFLNENKACFMDIMQTSSEFQTPEKYIKRMAMWKSNVWATGVEIFVTATLLQTDIVTYVPKNIGLKWVTYRPRFRTSVERSSNCLYLVNNKYHFEPVLQVSSQVACTVRALYVEQPDDSERDDSDDQQCSKYHSKRERRLPTQYNNFQLY